MTADGAVVTAFLVGLLGGVHCLGMCGGLVGTLTLGLDPALRRDPLRMLPFHLAYNLGRVAGYVLAGALVGGLGAVLMQADGVAFAQRALYGLSGVVMILLGLYLGGWWRLLDVVERAGAGLWRRIEPLGRRLLPIRRIHHAVAVGFVWASIPCGLVYSVLITALATGSPSSGALIMLAFALGTLPNLLGMALLTGAAARLMEQPWVTRAAGALVIAFGLYALWQLSGWEVG